ncbi:hypothetical protein [Paractinoplanes rishiriensis]|nr:hypothetical protein [Actinoplanes rishiriensis]
MHRLRAAAVFVLLCALVAACGADHPAPSEVPTGSAPSAGGPSGAGAGVADEPPGMIACARLAESIEDGSLMTPGVVDGVLAASETADAPVADSADRLKRAYDAALAAAGNADEPDAVAAVSAAASEMSDVCGDSGLGTAG